MVMSDPQANGDAAATQIFDYFFGSYTTPQEQRLRFVARNGVQHASEIFPRDPEPGQPVRVAILTLAALPIDHVAVYYTTDDADPSGERGEALHGQVALATPERSETLVGENQARRWWALLPTQPDGTLVRYRIDAWSDADGRRWVADAADPIAAPAPQGREFAYHVDRRRPPEWTHDAIVYHVFVDRFAAASDQPPLRDPGDRMGFYGGTIRGVTEKLDYIAGLGINCLWLSPVMESPTYHSYHPTDYLQVSQRFGTNDDLRELIAAAHARGMRVLLDFVANHTSDEHPAFLAAQRGEIPPEQSWYTFGPEYDLGYLAFFAVPSMPVLRTDLAPVRAYLIEMARRWLTDFGADGLRLDNVSGPAHAFWTIFQEGVKAQAPDALTLGEITGGMGDIATYGGRLDACMDFPMTKAVRQTFAQRAATLDDLLLTLAALATDDGEFAGAMARAQVLDNHDMHRFLWLAENDIRRLKLALTWLMTSPGLPVLYYGTEVGLSQQAGPSGQDAYAREPMPWGDEQRLDVLAHVRWLIGRRAERESLRRGRVARAPLTLVAGEAGQVGALARWTAREATVVVFNNGEMPARFTLDAARLPFARAGLWSDGAAREAWLLSPEGITRVEAPDLSGALPPLSALVVL